MTSGIDSDLLSDLGSRPTNALAVVELDIAGTARKFAEAWAASSTGLYEGYLVAESGEISRSVSDDSFQLPRDQARVRVRDPGRVLEQVLMGSAPGSVPGSAARVKIASRTRAQSKWFTAFAGVIDDYSMPEPFLWEFSLARDDRPLLELASIPVFQDYDWPDLPVDNKGSPAQIVYGIHSSTGTAATGMVPTTYVDNVLFRYAVSFGPMASIDAVYSHGALKTLTTDYTVDLAYFKNGRYWTIIDFVSDQGDNEITVDCNGLTSGGVIRNQATQLEHFLTNFGFGDWGASTTRASSAWLSASDFPIDETYFAEAEDFLSDKQVAKGGRVITAGRKGIDVLNEWMKQLQIPSFWTYGGKIAVRPDDHTLTSTYISSPWLRQEMSPEPDFLSVEFDASNLIDEVRADYIYSAADGSFQKALSVKDASKGHDAAASLQLHWLESVAV